MRYPVRFGRWLSQEGVERQRRHLHEREGPPLLRFSSVCDRLSGRHSPRLDLWSGIKRLAGGALTIEGMIEHWAAMGRERNGRVRPC